jgi:hypothetical protein
MSGEWKLPWEGGCRCDRLRFRVEAPPLLTMACHCRGCQRMTGSAFSLSLAVPTAGFAVTRGLPVIGGLHGAHRHFFCDHCKSWVFTRPEGLGDFVNLRATLLDDASWVVPFVETQTAEALPWALTPAPHSFERWPPMEDFPAFIEAFGRDGARPG